MSKKDKNQPAEELHTENPVEAPEEAIDTVSKHDTDSGESMDAEAALSAAVEKEKDKFLRLFAEFENYKKRTTRERMELFKTAGQEIMLSMLPVLDDFDRALTEIGKAGDKELFKGVELIHTKFKETLRAKGLQEVKCKKGDAFDAEIHEAITQIPAPTKKLKGKIVDVIETGYSLGEKIIRHPKVVVGN